jgi:hypothetical protein
MHHWSRWSWPWRSGGECCCCCCCCIVWVLLVELLQLASLEQVVMAMALRG